MSCILNGRHFIHVSFSVTLPAPFSWRSDSNKGQIVESVTNNEWKLLVLKRDFFSSTLDKFCGMKFQLSDMAGNLTPAYILNQKAKKNRIPWE